MMMFMHLGLLWLWVASALPLVSSDTGHGQSRRHHLPPIARNELNIISNVWHPLPLANRNLRRADDPTVQALLKNARPYSNKQQQQQQARKLDDNNNVQFDGSYSLKFSQCLDVQTYNANLFDQDILEYSSSGKVVSVKSYVLFYICQTDVSCGYDADDVDLYMVDLPTYFSSAAQYRANIRNDYCEACSKVEDYCNPQQEQEEQQEVEEEAAAAEAEGGQEANAGDEEEVEDAAAAEQENNAAAEEKEEVPEDQNVEQEQEAEKEQEQGDNPEGEKEEGGGRKLKKFQRNLASQSISCDQCNAYECFAAENGDDQVQSRKELDESVAEWIVDLAKCKETGVQWNDMNLYVSAMCSPYGDGVELAVFVDEDCTLYTNQQSFYDVWDSNNDNENGVNYMTYAEEIIQSAFSELTPCSQQEYGYPDGYAGDENQDNVEEGENEVNEYCQMVLEEKYVNFNNCAAEENANQANAADDDGQFSWYKYDVKDTDDINEVCTVLKQKEGAYTWSYDMETSGTWYERDKNGQITSTESATENYFSIAPAIIGVLVIISVFVIGGAVFLMRRRQKYAESSESVYSGSVYGKFA